MTSSEQLLRELIALPSVNPGFLPQGDPRAGEERVSHFLAAVAARSGLDIEFQPVFPKRSNLVVRLEPEGQIRRRVVLAPHLDTVVAGDEQFTPVIKNGRLYGRGACDTKGCVAAMLTALCSLALNGQRPTHTELIFVGLVDEENGQGGSRALAASGFKADLAIVGEPTQLKVVTAHKGNLWLRLETRGKSAHGSRPELGRNAVHEMARIVHLLQTEYAEELRGRTHPILGHATISVGTIEGGQQPNIVPDRCVITADRRTLPGETDAGVKREVKEFLKRHHLEAEVSNTKNAACLPLETPTELPLVQQLMKMARQPKPVGVDYFCDASVLAQGGIPSVVFGPGDIAQAHTADEWISLRSLERGTSLLQRYLQCLP